MIFKVIIFVFGVSCVTALWPCSLDAECSLLEGGACVAGACACPAGREPVDGLTRCAEAASYQLSPCVEHYQCSHLVVGFQCRDNQNGGECACRAGFHYFLGRCWQTRDYGESCVQQQECLPLLRDPHSLDCVGGACVCADGYYRRQRGECRKIAHGVGEECVLDADCQFENGACDYWDLVCYDTTAVGSRVQQRNASNIQARMSTPVRQMDAICSQSEDCGSFLACSPQNHCICPPGYYRQGNNCFAELGSPVRAEASCPGVFTVSGDTCRCPNNFYYEDNMRECIKVTVRFGDACLSDENCWTFGAASKCGAPQDPWGVRQCECDPAVSVLDTDLEQCRLFYGLGETCETERDCLAGDLQVLCAPDDEGVDRCSCPEHLDQVGGLCLTSGLELGEQCQASAECGAQYSECAGGECSCSSSYVQMGDSCRPAIGGECAVNADCVIDNTICQTRGQTQDLEASSSEEEEEEEESATGNCQCVENFVDYEQSCLPAASGYGAPCSQRVQCLASLGEGSECVDGSCSCQSSHHYRSGTCNPITGLMQPCERTPQCYLGDISERVVCRNDYCQCRFHFPYSEQDNTCLDSAASGLVIPSLLLYSFILFFVKFS